MLADEYEKKDKEQESFLLLISMIYTALKFETA